MEELNITYIWLLVGVVCLLIEAFGFPGTGLMFAGLGALTSGSLLYFSLLLESDTQTQFIVFFVATAAWAALLWKPIQKLRLSDKSQGYNNMIGDIAYVGSDGLTRHKGEVTWSGTIMRARLADNAGVDHLDAGTAVEIVAVAGATLMVKPTAQ